MTPTADRQDYPGVTEELPSLRMPGAVTSQNQYATTEARQ